MLVASLSDPHRQFVALSFRVNRFRDGRVGIGRHPASLHPPAIDVEGSDAAADGNCQSVPNAVVQLVVERFDPGQAQVSVVQSDLVLPAGALQLQKPTPSAIKRRRRKTVNKTRPWPPNTEVVIGRMGSRFIWVPIGPNSFAPRKLDGAEFGPILRSVSILLSISQGKSKKMR